MEAARLLEAKGIAARVVSAPAPQLLLAQEARAIESLLGPRARRVTLEAGATDYWRRVVDPDGLAIGVDRFGASAPYAALQEYLGLTPQAVASRIEDWLRR